MDSNAQHSSKTNNYCCLLCLAATPEKGSYVAIRSEEGLRINIEGLVRKYFAEEINQIEGCVCTSCCEQLGDFHRFYLRIKELQWNRKMKSLEGRQAALTEGFPMEMNIKEEKADDTYPFSGSTEEGLSNFLNEQFVADHSQNGAVQSQLLDSITNEFQASSLNNGNLDGCGNSHPFSKRLKRNITDPWQGNSARLLGNVHNQHDLEFLDEELYEYDKPPDDRMQSGPPPISPLEELERLRKENELLKRRNHQLVIRLREVHGRNSDLLQINRELTEKLRTYDPNALSKVIPSAQDLAKAYPLPPTGTGSKSLSVVASTSVPSSNLTASTSQLQPEVRQPKFISISGAYTLDNGDVVVMDSIIPSRTMMDIDSIEPGDKYDLKFVSKLAVALWGHERLAVSSVTGRKSNNAGINAAPTIQLEPEKLSFIKEKVYNRAMLETNDGAQAMARFDDSRINRLLNIKIQNAKRKKNLNFSGV